MASAKPKFFSFQKVIVSLPNGMNLDCNGVHVGKFDRALHEDCMTLPKPFGDMFYSSPCVLLVESAQTNIRFHVYESYVHYPVAQTQAAIAAAPAMPVSNIYNKHLVYNGKEIGIRLSEPNDMREPSCDCGALKTYGAQKGSPLHTRDGRGIRGCSWRNKELDNK